MIKVDKLFHAYGGRAVLDGISLEIARGELVVVMGPNGMGKSTLLGCVGGTIAPLEGTVTINGHQRRGTEASEIHVRKETVYLPDNMWVPETRSCRDWAYAVGCLYTENSRKVIDKIDALIDLFDMHRVADAPMSSYSAGQKKKAVLITALTPDVPVLVLDEPFSGGLDPTGLFVVKELLKRRAHINGDTILIATPTPELVEEVADRVVILKDGRVTAEGSLESLRQQTGFEGSLEGLYEHLNSSNAVEKLERFENRFLRS